jgi:hypothetical protein
VAGNNSVNAVFSDTLFNGAGLADSVSEYAVLASVDGNAVADLGTPPDTANNGWTNVPGSAAIGDNAGAFARGFTTGPDVFSTVFHASASNPFVSLNLDQRVASFCFVGGCGFGDSVLLLDDNGGTVAAPNAAPVLPAFEPAGPETVNIPFSSGALISATQVQVNDCAFATNTGECNVTQIVRPLSSAVRVKAVRLAAAYARNHKAHKHHKAHKTRRSHRKH